MSVTRKVDRIKRGLNIGTRKYSILVLLSIVGIRNFYGKLKTVFLLVGGLPLVKSRGNTDSHN